MKIELRGVEFVNKGAELMLYAITSKLKEAFPHAKLVMHQGSRTPKDKLKLHGIYSKVTQSTNPFKNAIKNAIPSFFYELRGSVKEDEIEVIIDGSGFAFGDQWGSQHAEKRLGERIIRWKKANKKIILLPQAFGSFDDHQLQHTMKRIIDYSDLIIAREKVSFSYLKQLSSSPKIKQYPDFTNIIQGRVPKNFNAELNIALIPNYKMLEQTSVTAQEYYAFLKRAIIACQKKQLNPFFLIHEGERDINIAKEVNKALSQSIPIVIEQDPLVIKGIISMMEFVICARFHGVVSALSQGVPAIVTGWSHKYELLMEDYGCQRFLIDDLSKEGVLLERINEVTDEKKLLQIKNALSKEATKQKALTNEMWETVFQVIKR